MNGISLFTDVSLIFVFRSETFVFMLILHPETLLNVLIHSNMYKIISSQKKRKILLSANNNCYTSFFPICLSFVSFYCMTALFRMSYTMLNKSVKSKHLCFVPNLRGKVFSLSIFSIIDVRLYYMTFIILSFCPILSFFFFNFLLQNVCWIL